LLLAAAVWFGLRVLGIRNVVAQKAAWVMVLLSSIFMPLIVPLSTGLSWLPHRAMLVVPADRLVEVIKARSLAGRTGWQPIRQAGPALGSAYSYRLATTETAPAEGHTSPSVSTRRMSVTGTLAPLPHWRAQSSLPAVRTFRIAKRTLAGLLYLLVSAVLAFRLVCGMAAAIHLWWSAEEASIDESLLPERRTRVRWSFAIASPVTVGSGIVLPAEYESWDREKLRIVLAHEQSHVRQGDFYLQALAGFYAAVFWFSPLGWWLKTRLSALGEAISDRAGVTQASSRASYARVLLQFAAMPHRAPVGVAMARRGSLTQRMERLLNEHSFRQAFSGGRSRLLAAVLLVPAALFGATALVRVEAKGQQAKPAQAPGTGRAHRDSAADQASQDRDSQDRTGQDQTGQDQTGQNQTGPDQAAQDQAAPDPDAQETAAADAEAQEQARQVQARQLQAGQEQAAPAPAAEPAPARPANGAPPAPSIPAATVNPAMPDIAPPALAGPPLPPSASPAVVLADGDGLMVRPRGSISVLTAPSLHIANKSLTRSYPQAYAGKGYSYSYSDDGESYALITGKDQQHVNFSGEFHTGRGSDLDKAKKMAHGDFLWFTHEGKSYVVDDPAIIAQIQAMYRPMEELSRREQELGKQQQELGRLQGELGERQAKTSLPAPDFAKEMAILSEEMAKLQSLQGGTVTQQQLAELQGKLGDLQGRLGALQGKMASRQGDLGAEQGRLGAKQGQLGAEQGRLGAEQGRLAAEADRKVKSLIDQSLRDGKARPVQ
jgi:beta-lactamase regulating signal transducer with metallopeptidase domain